MIISPNIKNVYFGTNSVQSIYYNNALIFPLNLNRFTITVNTLLGDSQFDRFVLPLSAEANYNFTVNWGDNIEETVTLTNSPSYEHIYTTGGIYTITITPTMTGFPVFFANVSHPLSASNPKFLKIDFGDSTEIERFGLRGCTNLESFTCNSFNQGTLYLFAWFGCTGLKTFSVQNFLSGQNFINTWRNCTSLKTINILNFPRATNFTGSWFNCEVLTDFPSINCPVATNFNAAWMNCPSLTSFNTVSFPAATNFTNTWFGCVNLTTFPAISTPAATTFSSTWSNCAQLTNFNFHRDTFANMTNGANCFFGVTLPTQTWSAILTSISATNTNLGVVFHGGGSKRNAAGTAAYNYLVNNRGWSITDLGPE